MWETAINYVKVNYPKEHRHIIRLWKTAWGISKPLSSLAILLITIPGLLIGFFGGKFIGTTNIYMPTTGQENVATTKATTPAFPVTGSQFARLRVHYTPTKPEPDVIEAENVLGPMSFMWDEGGSQITDPLRRVRWTILILVFDKPVTGSKIKVLFEGGEIPIEREKLTPRYAHVLFSGSLINKTVQVEIRP